LIDCQWIWGNSNLLNSWTLMEIELVPCLMNVILFFNPIRYCFKRNVIIPLLRNNLQCLFFSVGQLVRLERLSISGNLLTSLPATIGSLRNVSNYNNETWISSDFYTAIWNFEDCMHYALMCGYGYHHCILVGFQGVWDHFNHRHLRKEYFSMPYIWTTHHYSV
jgi:hypothetical protein